MQYIVTAMDFTDNDAINRRMNSREEHLVGIKKMIVDRQFLSGGAILDENGVMVGSSVHVEFESEKDLNNWLKNDPYIVAKVWDKIDVKKIKLIPVADILKAV